jgi:hypothetical protein
MFSLISEKTKTRFRKQSRRDGRKLAVGDNLRGNVRIVRRVALAAMEM